MSQSPLPATAFSSPELYVFGRISTMLNALCPNGGGLDDIMDWALWPSMISVTRRTKHLLEGDWAGATVVMHRSRTFTYRGAVAAKQVDFTLKSGTAFEVHLCWKRTRDSVIDYVTMDDPAEVTFLGTTADFDTWRTLARLSAPAGLASAI